ncbi:MAG: transposase, partial [Desulfovibrio sp.]|nr:transposase [Desulfovibrio sp.]
MAVPEEIRAVERPKNTIVAPYGKNGNLYAVRERVGCRYVQGRRIPVTGKTIGHIIEGKFVPSDASEAPKPVSQAPVDLKDWANVTLCCNISTNLLEELLAIYDKDDAYKLYCSSILRVCYPGVKDSELKDVYEECFLSEKFTNVALSKNTISKFWNDLGRAYSRICKFMDTRVLKVEKNHHLIIDGTLKTNKSSVNTLSDYSRKSKLKGSKDISILYAYDLEAEEPICSKCYPGNMIDATSYESFIDENNITKGIIVADRGFPSSCAKEKFSSNKDLHFVNAL